MPLPGGDYINIDVLSRVRRDRPRAAVAYQIIQGQKASTTAEAHVAGAPGTDHGCNQMSVDVADKRIHRSRAASAVRSRLTHSMSARNCCSDMLGCRKRVSRISAPSALAMTRNGT
jgi:hypothetical protein